MSPKRNVRGGSRTQRCCAALAYALTLLQLSACGSDDATPPPACDQPCQDNTAARGVREILKLAYNLTLQGKPVGPQDAETPCPGGGKVHVFGEASSNAEQGSTFVDLTYELMACAYLRRDDQIAENYDLTTTGRVSQLGTLAVQPTASTALIMESSALTISGTVYDPPLDYEADACRAKLGQSGNQLSGKLCGRVVGVDL